MFQHNLNVFTMSSASEKEQAQESIKANAKSFIVEKN